MDTRSRIPRRGHTMSDLAGFAIVCAVVIIAQGALRALGIM